MEHRSDLEDILLNGLPEQERHHTVQVMQQATARKREWLQAQGIRDSEPVDLTNVDDLGEQTLV